MKRKLTTVKEVWICDPNYHKIQGTFALNFSKNYQCLEKLYQTLTVPNVFFNQLQSVWISDETLFWVFDIASQGIDDS